MRLLADTHVHLYDAYDFERAFSSAFANLALLDAAGDGGTAGALKVLLLTERHGCRAFERLRERPGVVGRYRVETAAGDGALAVADDTGARLWIVAGRQVATKERLEVLALLGNPGVPDGGDILDTIGRISAAGAVPVLAWAPGKWTGRRAALVASVIASAEPGQLLVGDSSMRPRGWPTPGPMRDAAERGFAVVAGSDPLPFAGQEAVIGRYGIVADVDAVEAGPICALRRLFAGPPGRIALAGRRDSLPSVAVRLVRHRLGKLS